MNTKKTRTQMEIESINRFGKMNDYMERKAKDEPFVWEVGPWLSRIIKEDKYERIIYPTNKIKLLDIGPAIGAISSYLTINAITKGNAESLDNVELHLIDVSEEVIEKTLSGNYPINYDLFEKKAAMPKKRVDEITSIIKNAKGKVGKIQNLPFPDGYFDFTTANYVLHHIPNNDKQSGANEIQRVTKEGGFIFISDECISKKDFENYKARHKKEDLPLAKEEFLSLEKTLKNFSHLYLKGAIKGKEHYAFYGMNWGEECLWQHSEFKREIGISTV